MNAVTVATDEIDNAWHIAEQKKDDDHLQSQVEELAGDAEIEAEEIWIAPEPDENIFTATWKTVNKKKS